MLGPFERFLSRAGVAPDPSGRYSLHTTETPSISSQVDISVLPRRDLRTRFNLATRNGRSRIRIILPTGLEHRRFLYVGGRCMGLINPKSQPVIDVDLDDDLTGTVDVSLRLYWDVEPREEVHDALFVDWAKR